MTEINDEVMASIAKSLEHFLNATTGKDIGFVVFVFPFDASGITNVISNANKKIVIQLMEEALKKFKTNEGMMGGRGDVH